MSAQTLGDRTGIGGGGSNVVYTELERLAVLCSAVPEINEDLRIVSARVDALVERVDELEGDTTELQAGIDDLGEAFGQLATNVTALEDTVEEEIATLQQRQDDLEERLDAVEGCLNPELLEKQSAHLEAQEREFPFEPGDERQLVVEEIYGRPDATLRGKIEKVQTFVDVGDPAEYEEGDTVAVTITDLNHEGDAAHAVPTETFES